MFFLCKVILFPSLKSLRCHQFHTSESLDSSLLKTAVRVVDIFLFNPRDETAVTLKSVRCTTKITFSRTVDSSSLFFALSLQGA